MESPRGHVIVVTYPAQGHINPLLQFAKRLVSKGLKVSLATTHYTINSIQSTTVGIEPISDGFDEGGFKDAASVEAYLESFKRVGSKTLAELIVKFNQLGSPVNCIVYDSLLPWALEVARQFGIYAAVLLTNSASVCSLYWYNNQGILSFPVKQETSPLRLPGLPPLGYSELPSFLQHPATHSAYLAAIMEKFRCLTENDWVFCNSFEQLESQLVKALLDSWPLVMVGPLVPSAYLDQQIEGDTSYGANLWTPTSDRCLRWLDTKPRGSVVYISFGSMANLAAKQIDEISWGLKATNKNFLWVLRESENKLPTEFVNSTRETGLVVTWCNQLEVLAHPAVGCFVSHGGWNSTLEGLSLGVPMVAVPQWSDQPMNAKFVEEVWRVGVKAKRDEEGILKREELERCVKDVMVGERCEDMKRNASQWREHAKETVTVGGNSDKNVDQFVGKLLQRT